MFYHLADVPGVYRGPGHAAEVPLSFSIRASSTTASVSSGRGNAAAAAAVESAGGTGSACGPPQRAFVAFIRHVTTVVLVRATTSPAHVAATADGSGTSFFFVRDFSLFLFPGTLFIIISYALLVSRFTLQ